MHVTSFLTLAASALASVSTASPISKREAGPSGQVLSPAGGTIIPSTQGYPTGIINLSYKPVYQTKSSDCGYYGCSIETWYISASLKDSSGNVTPLAEYLSVAKSPTDNIEANLRVPKNYCGDYNLVIHEYQNKWGDSIDFQSAAPKIHIECDPLP